MNALQTGYTTGTCATAATMAALCVLMGEKPPASVCLTLPEGEMVRLSVKQCAGSSDEAHAIVRKRAGDDPDVTDGAEVHVTLRWMKDGDVMFRAGPGVGCVTKPGLALAPGEPAINPGPRRMIRDAIRRVTARPVEVTIGVPGGELLAQKTFNPRLGIEGGLSVLGTSGVVRPFSTEAVRETIRCALSVAAAAGVRTPILVPGHIGRRAALRHFQPVPDAVIEVGNEWGFAVDRLKEYSFTSVRVVGHPGKLVKLAAGDWDTHSARSRPALHWICERCTRAFPALTPPAATTAEGFLASLPPSMRHTLANTLARETGAAIAERAGIKPVEVVLIDLQGERWGCA